MNGYLIAAILFCLASVIMSAAGNVPIACMFAALTVAMGSLSKARNRERQQEKLAEFVKQMSAESEQ